MTTEELITFSRIANEKLNCLMLTEQLAESGEYTDVSLWDAIDDLKNNQLRHPNGGVIPYIDEDILKIYGNILKYLSAEGIAYILEDIKVRNKMFENHYMESLHQDDYEDEWED